MLFPPTTRHPVPRFPWPVLLLGLAPITLMGLDGCGQDTDGDGWTQEEGDCNDQDATVYPGATDLCADGLDSDCDGVDCTAVPLLNLEEAYASLIGEREGDNAGISVASAGDINGDGQPDLLIGAYLEGTGGDSAGAAYLIHGPVDGPIDLSEAAAKLVGEEGSDWAGKPVAGVGDVNGDGYDDILIGAYLESSNGSLSGAAYLMYGPVSGTVDLSRADVKLMGGSSVDHLGIALSGAGDVNGDGYADVIIGAYKEDSGGNNAGTAYLFYGPLFGNVTLDDADAILIGERSDDGAGRAVAAGGDINGDGYDDVLVGAFQESSAGEEAGAVYVLYGPLAGTIDLGDADGKLLGEAAGDSAGWGLSGAGDVNGDGYDDVLVGSPTSDRGGSDGGAAYLVYGPILGESSLAEAGAILVGENPGDEAGYAVSGPGDLDGDGYDDLLIGAYLNDGTGTDAGAVYVMYGPLLGMLDLGMSDAKLAGQAGGDNAGIAVSSAGDQNGDGRPEVLVGAPFNSEGGAEAGAAYVVSVRGL